MGVVKGARVCKSQCFVSRDSINGQLNFGCGECDDPELDCKTCTEKYCNEERLVPKHCWINDKEICKTDFDIPCHMERISINESKNLLNLKNNSEKLKQRKAVETVKLKLAGNA
uniref:Uncharacterized protein n=1 Tax=Meloidogyne enterolobii TaxID=390850 RepID=A0A6V7VIG6_MELEN|nr:unnamed protein product [Meloidogyne enterolobii]